ncbi:hypothetical protein GF369_04870 [Candidatus Peregrinibacteria bacterium]|nr:hypothetical protein [Candidatus Peregrinibacteria bacterium]
MSTVSKRLIFIAFVCIVVLQPILPAFAQDGPSRTFLPQTEVTDCNKTLLGIEQTSEFPIEGNKENTNIGKWFAEKDTKSKNDILACAIKTGRVHFWMIPYFIVYFIEFLIGIAGLVAIFFIVIGGYQLVISGANDQKDAAKNTIKHALMGLVLVLVAWVVVNVVQYVLTI